MAVRMYLFAMRTSASVAMARYMATDDPRNLDLWRGRDPFTRTQHNAAPPDGVTALPGFAGSIAYSTLRARVARYRDYLNDPGAPAQLDATSWSWCDITGWRDTRLSDAEKTATIPPAMAALLTSSSPVPLTQWAHPMDVALAGAWLARARQTTPDDIDLMAPRDQHDAIMKMWGAFANYWKALNLSVQAWGKYRDAWEAATRTGVGVVLMSDDVVMPRPCASLVPFSPIDDRYTGSALWERVGPWREEALTVNNLVASRAREYPRPVTDLSSWGAGYGIDGELYFSFGNFAAPQPVGPGVWGEPERGVRPPSQWDWRTAQERVVSGSSGFGPMHGSHYVWVNNNAIMTGGMAPYWHRVTGDDMGGWARSIRCPPQVVGGGEYILDPPSPDWNTGYLISDPDEIAMGGRLVRTSWGSAAEFELEGAQWLPIARIQWQPPPKRYVDLLWPLLEYLATQDPRAIAHEVMIDVLGKNTFTIIASGMSDSPEAVQAALNSAIGQQRQATVSREAARDALGNMVRGVATGVISTIAGVALSPLAGAAVGAGLNALFAVADAAADIPETPSNVRAAGSYDVFGRIDGVTSRGGKLIGMIERYALRPMTNADVDQVIGQIYGSINQRSENSAGPLYWAPGFVMPEGDFDPTRARYVPWPVGYEFLQTNEPPPPGQPMNLTVTAAGLVATVLTVRPPPTERRVQLSQTATPAGASGPSPAVSIGVGVGLGAAVGLVVAARNPRSNPRARRRRR